MSDPAGKKAASFLAAGLLVALALAALSPLASRSPDGLERVADRHGFASEGKATFPAPLPDYWEDRGPLHVAAAGILGTLLVFGATYGIGAALRRRKAAP